MTAVPDWITQHIERRKVEYGLHDWMILTEMSRRVNDDDSLACSRFDCRYLRVKIEIRDSVQPDEEGYQTLDHELIHVALASLEMAKDRIIDLVPEHLRQHARDIWIDADEPTTERLSRAQAAMLGKPKVI